MNDVVYSEIFFLEDDTLEIKMKYYIFFKISVYSIVGKVIVYFFCVRCRVVLGFCCGFWGVERGEGEVKL